MSTIDSESLRFSAYNKSVSYRRHQGFFRPQTNLLMASNFQRFPRITYFPCPSTLLAVLGAIFHCRGNASRMQQSL